MFLYHFSGEICLLGMNCCDMKIELLEVEKSSEWVIKVILLLLKLWSIWMNGVIMASLDGLLIQKRRRKN